MQGTELVQMSLEFKFFITVIGTHRLASLANV